MESSVRTLYRRQMASLGAGLFLTQFQQSCATEDSAASTGAYKQ